MTNMYKKEYAQVFEIKDENWRKKYDYKNLKDFSYEVDKTKKEEDKTVKKKIKQIKNYHEFNELKDRLLGLKNNELKTSTNKHEFDFSYMKKLIKDIANNKTTKNDAINILKEDSGYIEEIKNLKRKGNRSTVISN